MSEIFSIQVSHIENCTKGCETAAKKRDEETFYLMLESEPANEHQFDLESKIQEGFFEKVSADPFYSCPECESKTCKRKTEISRLPEFIFVHLMESDPEIDNLFRLSPKRKDVPINVPHHLDEKVFGHPYSLHSIIDRRFNQFVALIRNPETDEWYSFNDSNVYVFPFDLKTVRLLWSFLIFRKSTLILSSMHVTIDSISSINCASSENKCLTLEFLSPD